jgi:hypothetical protein
MQFFAMKMLKKVEIVRMKQVEHMNSERQILKQIHHPFIVNLCIPNHRPYLFTHPQIVHIPRRQESVYAVGVRGWR